MEVAFYNAPEPLMGAGFEWSGIVQTELRFGGAGGNRTPVRKPSTDSSTYLAWLFDLTYATPTDKRCISELPWI